MTWNYRVVKQYTPDDKYTHYSIHEVYYDIPGDDSSITLWSDSPVGPFGETFSELTEDFERIAEAFKKPVLDSKDLPWNKKSKEP